MQIPTNPRTLGDHIKKRRLEQDLFQKDVARILRVDKTTVYNWERNRSKPALQVIPRVVEFLGYVPDRYGARTLREKIAFYRRLWVAAQKQLAKELNVDPSTLGRWERDEGKPEIELEEGLASFFKILS